MQRRRSRPAAQAAGYLMLPLGRGLGFHLRHKHAWHLSLHRAKAAHGATPSLQVAGSRPEEALQQAAREQYRSYQDDPSAPPKDHPEEGRGRMPGSDRLFAAHSGSCSAAVRLPSSCLLVRDSQIKKEKKQDPLPGIVYLVTT